MTFKEHIQHDISGTFENLNEFANTAEINGATVYVIEDKDQLLYRIKKNYDGLVVGDILFTISVGEWQKVPHASPFPKANEAVTYNGRPCTIVEVSPQEGMFEITLQKVGAY